MWWQGFRGRKARSQTQDKWLTDILINIKADTGSFSLILSVSTNYRVWLAYPALPYPPAQGSPASSHPSIYNSDIFVTWSFWSTLLTILLAQAISLGWWPHFPLPSPLIPLFTWPSSVSPCSLGTILDVPVPGYILPFIHNNFLLHDTCELLISFPFSFFYFFFFSFRDIQKKQDCCRFVSPGRKNHQGGQPVAEWKTTSPQILPSSRFQNTSNESQNEQIQSIKQLVKQNCSFLLYWQDGTAHGGPNERPISNSRLLSLKQKQQIEDCNGDTHEDYVSDSCSMPAPLSSQQLSQSPLSEAMQRKKEARWILLPALQYLGKNKTKQRNLSHCYRYGLELPLHW